MISYGSQLGTLKRQVIQYITGKTKEPGYKNDPTILRICQSGTIMALVSVSSGTLETKLDECSVERLCNIADKFHFRPLREAVVGVPIVPVKKQEVVTTETKDMGFEIKNNIPLPGQVFTKPVIIERKSSSYTNYRTLPLKDLKVGECIIIHECKPSDVTSKYQSAKTGVEKFVGIMDTKKKFKVAKTDDNKVGVWRVE